MRGGTLRKIVMKCVVAAALLSVAASAAPILGQIDTFQDNTLDNWFSGGLGFGAQPAVPPHLASGGQAGSGDLYMVVTGIGGQPDQQIPGSRISVINNQQWAGNYLT